MAEGESSNGQAVRMPSSSPLHHYNPSHTEQTPKVIYKEWKSNYKATVVQSSNMRCCVYAKNE